MSIVTIRRLKEIKEKMILGVGVNNDLIETIEQLRDVAKAVTDHWARQKCGGIEEKVYKLRDLLAEMEGDT